MHWILILALAFLFYAKSVGMVWFATIMICFAIIGYCGYYILMILSIKLAPLNLTKLVLFTREIGIESKLIGAVNL